MWLAAFMMFPTVCAVIGGLLAWNDNKAWGWFVGMAIVFLLFAEVSTTKTKSGDKQ